MKKRARTYRAGADGCGASVRRFATTGSQHAMMGVQRATTGMKVTILATMGIEVKKKTSDNGYATPDDGYKVGQRRLLDRETTGRGRARTTEIA